MMIPSLPPLSRRHLLGITGSSLLGASLGPGLAFPAAALGNIGDPLVTPSELRSSGGVLDVTLVAEPVTVVVDGIPRKMLGYNGEVPGPTLRIKPGDLLKIRLVNHTSEPTNLHTHGLHVSGENNADNMMITVDPGESFDYEIQLRHDASPGTNWYHPHFHHTGGQQIFSGLAGAMITEPHGVPPHSFGIARERIIHLGTSFWDSEGKVASAAGTSQSRQIRLVNGQIRPTIDIAPGETQLWRFVNSSVNHVHRLVLDGHRFTRIAADGMRFREAQEINELVLSSGQRADVLVTGASAGTYPLRVLPYNFGFGVVSTEATLATVVSGGTAPATQGPLRTQPLLAPFVDLRKFKVDRRRTLAMTMAGGFGIDGQPFDHDRFDQICELGSLEEWTITNPTGLVHPFHIHVNPFQVTKVNGVPVDANSYEDTVIVDRNGGSVTFLTRFEHFLGRAMYHCHFVTHSDLGMMGQALIVPRGHADLPPRSPH